MMVRAAQKLMTAGAVVCAVWLGSPRDAQATAMFTAEAVAVLTIDEIRSSNPNANFGDLVVEPFDDVELLVFTEEGDGVAVFSGTSDASADELDQAASVSGSASDGFAEAVVLTTGLWLIENVSDADDFEIDFTLDWSVYAEASTGHPFDGVDAIALVSLLFDEELVVEFFAEASDFDPGVDEDAGVLPFGLTFSPGDFLALELRADALGFAESFGVPEPATFVLLPVATAFLLRRRRR